mmetsp:Transcript_10520/g.64464  ORF Transcript_10520/g.64464 Transcript_10520/m.64464 type:complete len:247 (+) Transcript_10520:17714-18454(+)
MCSIFDTRGRHVSMWMEGNDDVRGAREKVVYLLVPWFLSCLLLSFRWQPARDCFGGGTSVRVPLLVGWTSDGALLAPFQCAADFSNTCLDRPSAHLRDCFDGCFHLAARVSLALDHTRLAMRRCVDESQHFPIRRFVGAFAEQVSDSLLHGRTHAFRMAFATSVGVFPAQMDEHVSVLHAHHLKTRLLQIVSARRTRWRRRRARIHVHVSDGVSSLVWCKGGPARWNTMHPNGMHTRCNVDVEGEC